MNPLTNVRNVAKLNEQDLRNGIFDHTKTWHTQYKDSAYIFIGGLPYDLTEGDILCVFSQYGEIVNINLVRDKKTGKSKGYGFICYEDQRSTILAVDNFNGIKLDGRTIRVDHVLEYRIPKSDEKGEDGKFKNKIEQGCAPKTPSPVQSDVDNNGLFLTDKSDKKKKKKKEKKKKKKKGKDVESGSEEEEMIRFREKIKEQNEKDSSRRTDGRKETERKRYRSRSPSNDKINSKRGRKGHDSRSPLPDRRYERERSTSRDDKRKRGKREDSYSPERRRRRSRSPSPDRYRSSKDHSRRR